MFTHIEVTGSVVMSQKFHALWIAVEPFPAGDPVVDPSVTHDVKVYLLKSDTDLRVMFEGVSWLCLLEILDKPKMDSAFIQSLKKSENSQPYEGFERGDNIKSALQHAFRLGVACIKKRDHKSPNEDELDSILTRTFTHMDEEKVTLLEGSFRKRLLYLMKKAYMQGQGCACTNANMVIRGADSISRLVE